MSKDQEIFELIKQTDHNATEKVYLLYRDEFLKWIKKQHKCTNETAIELYQDSFIVFYENIINGKLSVLTSSLKTYLFSIGWHKLNELFRYNSKIMPLLPTTEIIDEDTNRQYCATDLKKVGLSLEHLGNPCKDLLIAFYYNQKSLNDIVNEMGYKNTDTVKNVKYKCLERLRKLFKNKDLESENATI